MDYKSTHALRPDRRFHLQDFPLGWHLQKEEIDALNQGYNQLLLQVLRAQPASPSPVRSHFPHIVNAHLHTWASLIMQHMRHWQNQGLSYAHGLHRQIRNHPTWIREQHIDSTSGGETFGLLYLRFLEEEAQTYRQEPPTHPLIRWVEQKPAVPSLAAEPALRYLRGTQEATYEAQVEADLKQLQATFLDRYARSPDPEWLVQIEIQLLERLLHGAVPVPGVRQTFGDWRLSAAALAHLQAEFRLLVTGQKADLLRRRAGGEPRPAELPCETESLLQLSQWLRQGRYRVRHPLPAPRPPDTLTWLGSHSQLEHLYAYLQQHDMIDLDITWDDFQDHFDSEYGEPLCWTRDNSLLVYCIDQLIGARFFPTGYYQQLHILIAAHFLNRHHQSLKPNSLASTRSQSPNPRNHQLVDRLLRTLGPPLTG